MRFVRRWWLLFILGLIVAAWVTLARFVPGLTESVIRKINASLAVAGWVLFFGQYLYHTSERIFFATNRLWLWLSNKSVRWTLKVSLEGIREPVSIQEIVTGIRDSYGRDARVWQEESAQAIVNLPGWTIRISHGRRPEYADIGPGEEDFTTLEVTDLEVPFRESENRIGRRIFPLVERLVKMVDATSTKYAAIISFKGSNPYFGFFIKRVSPADVVDFQCEYFDLVAGERERVSVRKDRIELVSNSLSGIAYLSLKYLALSPEVSIGRA